MSSWPPPERQNPVSYISADNDGEEIVQKLTTIDFVGLMSSVASMGSGVARVTTGLRILTENPASAEVGDAWILRVDDSYSISHPLVHLGLTMLSQSFIYYLKIKSDSGSILSLRFS